MAALRTGGSIAALVGAAVAVSVPWAFGYLLPQVGTLPLAMAALAGYSPYLLAVVFALAAALRRWPVAAVGAALLVGQLVTLAPAYTADDRARSGPALRVMTLNMRFGQADSERVVRLVRDRRVDVLALEELTRAAVRRLEAAGLRAELPYACVRAVGGAGGTGLWSRLPTTEPSSRALTFKTCAADLTFDGQLVRLRAVHTVPPLAGQVGWRRDFSVLRAQGRDDVNVPTVLLGDFNASVHHRQLRRLMGERWRDAAEVAGVGVVRTWSPRQGFPAVLDPDHVLVDRGMGVLSAHVVSVPGSDHRAVLAEIALGRT